MVIYPEVFVTPDTPTIRFNQPREKIELEKQIEAVLHAQGWNCGTFFNVVFMNHDKTQVLACGRFVVSEESENLQVNNANPYQPVTKTVYTRRAEQIGDWWAPKKAEPKKPEASGKPDNSSGKGKPDKQAA